MSSLSRRACYKCGNVGHYAEVCSSAERLCYNCKRFRLLSFALAATFQAPLANSLLLGKQPGHESNSCPLPRTTDAKQCYHCQGLGHVQADCPTLRLTGASTGGRCYNCGQPGHLAVCILRLSSSFTLLPILTHSSKRACQAPNAAGLGRGVPMAPRGGYGGYSRGGFAAGGARSMCYKCGGPNHFARDCQAQAMKCYACGKLGHISRDCTAPNGGPLNTAGKTCYQCGEAGHISRDCPQKNTNGEIPAEIPVPDATNVAAAPAAVPPIAPVA